MTAPALTIENYQTYLPQMEKAIYKVYGAIGGDLDDMRSNLYFLFEKAINNFRPEAGKSFKAYLYKVVWDDTFSARRIEIDRKRRLGFHPITEVFDIPDRHRFSLRRFMEELSDEAKMAVAFVLNPPEQVKLKSDGTPNARYILYSIRTHYRWTAKEMTKVVEEIQACLS